MAKATFGAGCFWGVEAAFRQVPGVTATAVGYSGGHTENPTLPATSAAATPATPRWSRWSTTRRRSRTTKLLQVFWENHDPTQVNRQGPDVGAQYRSAIFFHTPEQEAAARASKAALEASGRLRRPIATEITPASTFWRGRGLPPAIPGEARPGGAATSERRGLDRAASSPHHSTPHPRPRTTPHLVPTLRVGTLLLDAPHGLDGATRSVPLGLHAERGGQRAGAGGPPPSRRWRRSGRTGRRAPSGWCSAATSRR